MEDNLSYSSEVKKGLISLLMFTLYSDAKTIFREYVQNSLDSINNAVKQNVLKFAKDGCVNIEINSVKRTIIIKDNGTGINSSSAVRILLDISASNKDGVSQAGQFGIGRLVGGGYCHELIFRTTSVGEEVGTEITFDVDKIWKMVKEDKEEYLATQVINECTIRKRISADINDHYFEVIMNGVKEDMAPDLLDKNSVVNYLNAVAPVAYKSQFNNTIIYKSTKDNQHFKDLHEGVEKIKVYVNSIPIEKQYGLSVNGTKDKINNLEYFELEDARFGVLGWGWFALTKYSIQIPKSDDLACIRLRKHNIQIGDSSQLSGNAYWKEERSNSYFYGEFFVTHPNIVPNAARDGLAPTPESNRLNVMLREYFEKLKSLYTKANEAKKCIDKINEGIVRLKNFGLNDRQAKDFIENKGCGKFEGLLKKSSFLPTLHMLHLYQPSYNEAMSNVDKVKQELGKRDGSTDKGPSVKQEDNSSNHTTTDTSSVVSEIVGGNADISNLEPPTSISNEPDSKNNTDNVLESGNSSSSNTDTSRETNVSSGTIYNKDTDISIIVSNNKDIISPLKAILNDNEIWMLRRVFQVLNFNCPKNEHDRKLIEEMEELIVKEFQKQ